MRRTKERTEYTDFISRNVWVHSESVNIQSIKDLGLTVLHQELIATCRKAEYQGFAFLSVEGSSLLRTHYMCIKIPSKHHVQRLNERRPPQSREKKREAPSSES